MAARRLTIVVVAFCLTAAVVAGRLIQLQFVESARLTALADRQQTYVEPIPARPGDIVDRHGRLLAVTIRASSLYAVPEQIERPREFAEQLATVLEIDVDRLSAALERDRDKSFLWIDRRMSDEQAEAVRSLALPAGSWGFRHEYLRRYPQGGLAAHVIGLRDVDNVGRGGVEERFDAELRGFNGRRVVRRDAIGRAVDVRDEQTTHPRPGRTVVLTIDAVIQRFAEAALDDVLTAHAPQGACAVVLSVPDAQVLALASRPTFDPNAPADAAGDAWTNRAVTAVYEPGSTFKPLVVAWALDAGVLHTAESIDCEHGAYSSHGRVLHDHHGYGTLSISDVLVKSSNIGMAKIGERLETGGLHDCVVAFGFGRPTGIELPGERSGVVRPLSHWNDFSVGSVPMGHEIAVTPIQLAAAHAALARGGRWQQPRLVLRDVDASLGDSSMTATGLSSTVASTVIDEAAASWVVSEPMVEVVRRGTGRSAAVEGYTVFGKTGTAQKFDAATGTFSNDRHVVSFVGGAPADDPQVLVLVMVDEPTGASQSGGSVAAPAAAAILDRTLRHLGIPAEDRSLDRRL